jgi:hypothetical protein
LVFEPGVAGDFKIQPLSKDSLLTTTSQALHDKYNKWGKD